MTERGCQQFAVPIALLQKVLPHVPGLIDVKQDDTALFDQRKSVTERQDRIDERKWLGRQKRLAARDIPSKIGIAQLRIAILRIHSQRHQIFEAVGRQNRIEAKRRARCVEVGRFWLGENAQAGHIDQWRDIVAWAPFNNLVSVVVGPECVIEVRVFGGCDGNFCRGGNFGRRLIGRGLPIGRAGDLLPDNFALLRLRKGRA